MGRIFISHQNNPADNAWAAKVHAWIKDQKGIRGFLDFDVEDGIKAGEEWEKKIYASMNAAQVVIAIVSKDWLESSWCMSEARMARLLGRKLILIITEKCEVPFRATQSIRLEKHGEDRAFEELRETLQTTHNPPARPYPGLATFAQEDAAVFFGREDETKKLENQLESLFEGRPETERLLLLLGASGSGKSSLMRAGVLPGFEERKAHHAIRPIIPRGDPLGELAVALGTGPLGPGTTDDAARTVLDQIAEHAPGCERILLPIDQAEELLRGDHSRFFEVLKVVLERGNGRIIALMTMRSDFLNAFQQSGLIGTGTPLPYDTYTLDPLPQKRLPDIIQKPAEIYGVTFEEGLVARIMADHGGPDALPLLAFFLSEFWTPQYIKDGRLEIPEYEHSGGIDGALKGAVDEALKRCAKVKPEETDARKLSHELREIFLGHLVGVSAGSGDPVRRRAAADTLTGRQVALLKEFARKRLLIERDGTWEVTHEALFRKWEDLKAWIDAAREDLVAINRIEAAAAHWDDEGRREEDLTHSGSRLSEALGMWANPRYAERFDETATTYLEACRKKEDDRLEQEKALRETAERERDRAERQRAEAEAAQKAAEQQKAAAEEEARRALRSHRLSLMALSSTALKTGRPEEAAYLALAAWPRTGTALDDLAESGKVVLDALVEVLPELREVRRFSTGTLENGEIFVDILAVSSDGKSVTLLDSKGQASVYRLHTDGSVSGHALPENEISDFRELQRDAHSAFIPASRYFLRDAFVTTGWELAERDGTFIKPMTKVKSISDNAFHRGDTHVTVIDVEKRIWLWDLSEDHPKEILKDIQRQWEFRYRDNEVDMAEARFVLSPDGAFVAVWERDKVRVFDCITEQEMICIDTEPPDPNNYWTGESFTATFSPCGSLWAGFMVQRSEVDEVEVRVWDLRIGSHSVIIPRWPVLLPAEAASAPSSTEDRSIRDIQYSADGSCLSAVVPSANGVNVVTWNLVDGRRTASLELSANVAGKAPDIVLCPDGELALVGAYTRPIHSELSDHEIFLRENYRVLEIASGQDISAMDLGRGNAKFIGEGPLVMEKSSLSVSLYDIQSDRKPLTVFTCIDGRWEYPDYDFTGLVRAAAFSPDGSWFVACEDGLSLLVEGEMKKFIVNPFGAQVRLWSVNDESARVYSNWEIDEDLVKEDFEDGDEGPIFYNDPAVLRFLFSPCGEMVAMISVRDAHSISFRDPVSGRLLGQLRFSDEEITSIDEIAFTPDGSRIAVPTSHTVPTSHRRVDGVSLYDIGTGERMAHLACPGGFRCMTVAPDGNHVFVGQQDGSILRWNVAYGAGTLFDIVYRRMPVLTPPAIAIEFGMALDEEVFSGEEPLPNTVPVPKVKQAHARDLPLGYPIPVIGPDTPATDPWALDAVPLDDLLRPPPLIDPDASFSVPPDPQAGAGDVGDDDPFADLDNLLEPPPAGATPSIEDPADVSDLLMPPPRSPPPDQSRPTSTPPTDFDWAENPLSPPPKPRDPFD